MGTLTEAQKKKVVTVGNLEYFLSNLSGYVNMPVYTAEEYESKKNTIAEGTQFILNDSANETLTYNIKTSTGYKTIGGSGGGSTTIIDNLNSTSTAAALSANQGKVLGDMLGDVAEVLDYINQNG